ncbi:MAG TPA: Stp1/IreP family PP2C-type Ser/Thr phosphatase [Gemmataceae bacterium]|jgi:protein phosphatase|nr:Stp1/IreP family PP2C-type Ser/Thr phosphatase [Gemmataceae bacterium]
MIQTKTEPELAQAAPVPPLPTPPLPFTVQSCGLTDAGRVRPSNEDHFVIVELARTLYVRQTSVPQAQAQYGSHRGHLFLIADGMGGHQAGEVASALSALTIEGFLLNTLKRFFKLEVPEEQNVMKEFQGALLQADARIFEEASQHSELIGMGTTLTMAFAVNWRLFVAHVGDSRCYLFSKGELHQLTEDHTLVAEMVRAGMLSPAGASRHPYRHVVTNVLGGNEPGVRVEMHKLDLEPADVLVLCSDGLTKMVPDARIAAILQEEREPRRACERLVAEANERGGKDNITVVVACFGEA